MHALMRSGGKRLKTIHMTITDPHVKEKQLSTDKWQGSPHYHFIIGLQIWETI